MLTIDVPITKRKPGRPPTGNSRVHITLRLPRWLMRALEAACQAAGLSRTAYIESKLSEGLDKPEEK